MSWSIGKKWKFSFSRTNEHGGKLFFKDFRKNENLIFFHFMWPLNWIKIKIVFLVTRWTLFHYLYFSDFPNKHSRNKWWNMWWVFSKNSEKRNSYFLTVCSNQLEAFLFSLFMILFNISFSWTSFQHNLMLMYTKHKRFNLF